MEVRKETAYWILGDLASKHNVPIGIEIVPEETNERSDEGLQINVKDGTVKEALDAFVQIYPYYKWEEVNGVINISPKIEPDPLLETMISNFEVKQKNAAEISEAITKLPEVEIALRNDGLEAKRLTLLKSKPYDQWPKLSFTVQDKTVREILNHIIRTQNCKYWAVSRWGRSQKYIEITVW
jgi:hypothetical protein